MPILSRQPSLLLLQVSALVGVGTAAAWFAGGAFGMGSTNTDALVSVANAVTVDGAALPSVEAGDALLPNEIDRLLDNASLAMAAEQYFSPPEQNARGYYESVLELDPEHAQANLGLDRLAEIVLERATGALAQEQVQTAINQLAAAKSLRPGHRLVALVEQQLQTERSRLINTAQVLARSSNFDLASDMLSRAEAIPSRRQDGLQNAWDELGSLRSAAATAAAAEASANEAAILQAEAARVEAQAQSERERALEVRLGQLLVSARAAIEEDRLLSPEWENAKQLISELDYLQADQVAMARLRGAYLNKLVDGVTQRIEGGDFDSAEGWITEAAMVNENDQRLPTLREQVADARHVAESQRIANLNEFEFANYVPPRYPTVARQRGAEGWVEVEFLVQEDGSISDIVVLDSARTANFRDAALTAIRQWQLQPRTYLGRPLSQRVRTRLAFRLGD
ncbi:MAG: energy transducer TonB [Pseudomonadota bacterium]